MSKRETDASQIAGLVPQVFYDLIGRIAPGAFLLVMGFLLLHREDCECSVARLLWETKIPYSLLLLLGLLFSYMTGILLGGIGYFIEDILRKRRFVILHKGEILSDSKPNIDSISYLYDAIQYYDPATGARLAKLSAEKNMCRVLIVGYVILIIVYFMINRMNFNYWLLLFLVSAICSALFYVHLEVRSYNLINNYRYLLKREEKAGMVSKTCASPKEDHQVVTDRNGE